MYQPTLRITLLLLYCTLSFSTQAQLNFYPRSIPMRDGKSLAADFYTLDSTAAKPVILIQTPYNKDKYHPGGIIPPQAGGLGFPLDADKYHYVIVDVRGFYGSQAATASGYTALNGKDGYDCVEWIAGRSWCNGKVGTWGGSALGVVQFNTAAENPPHLVCSVPMIADYTTEYSDFYYGGDFRKEETEAKVGLGFFSSTALILQHPSQDVYWNFVKTQSDLTAKIQVPMLMITGWIDHNPTAIINCFTQLRQGSASAVRNAHKLIVGPWTHTTIDQDQVGALTYPDVKNYGRDAALRFFDHYLNGASNSYPSEPVMRYYQMGENRWYQCSSWQSVATQKDTLFLHPGGGLRPQPNNTTFIDTFAYNPRNPTPSYGGQRFNPFVNIATGPVDERQVVENRNDVLIYSTDVLNTDLVISGSMSLLLYASTDQLDTDFAVRLTDVQPDGSSLVLTDGIRRLRYRNGYSSQVLPSPGTVYPVQIDLTDMAMTFKAGHRLRLVVSSADYPRFDLNLNNGDSLYRAGDTLVASNKIYTGGTYPSHFVYGHGPGTAAVGIAAPASQARVQLYPNPAFSSVQVLAYPELKAWRVIDTQGRVVSSGQVAAEAFSIDASHWPNGCYTVLFMANETIESHRLLVQH